MRQLGLCYGAYPVNRVHFAPSSRRAGLVLLLVTLVWLACYARAVSFEFVWDDYIWFLRPGVFERSLLSALGENIYELVNAADTQLPHRSYRPLAYFSMWLDMRLAGPNPVWMHAHSLALGLVYFPLWLFLGTRLGWSPLRRVVVLAFFLLHPLQAEVIAYVSGRPDLIAGLLVTGSLALTITAPGNERRPSWARLVGVGVLFFLSLLSKEGAIGLPIAVLLLAVGVGRLRDWWPGALSMMAALGVYLVFRVLVLGTMASGSALALSETVLALPGVALQLFRSFWWPTDLSMSRVVDDSLRLPGWGSCVVSGVILLVEVGRLRRSAGAGALWWRLLALLASLWSCFVVLVGPSALVALVMDTVSDRYAHVAAILAFIGLGEASGWFPSLARERAGRLLVASVLGILLAVESALCFVQVGFWRDPIAGYERAIAVAPENPMGHYSLGEVYAGTGRPLLALPLMEKALELSPTDDKIWNNYGSVLFELGRLREAQTAFERALSLTSGQDEKAWFNLALVAIQREDASAACGYLNGAVQAGSHDPRTEPLREQLCRMSSPDGPPAESLDR